MPGVRGPTESSVGKLGLGKPQMQRSNKLRSAGTAKAHSSAAHLPVQEDTSIWPALPAANFPGTFPDEKQ